MESMTGVKSELSLAVKIRRPLCLVQDDALGNKSSVKRRRRDSASSAVVAAPADQQVDQIRTQADQSTAATATTTTVKRSSRFRGVSRHRWTGRYEAHLWDKGSWNPTQRKKGKQVYLGAYDEEESAARAYDMAALKYWGTSTFTNFPVLDYEGEIEIMNTLTKEEYLASLRRRSSGFSRGVSKYRGVARHHHNGRWEARIGRVFGNKYLYLGTYGTQEEAAHAYDIAAIEYRGLNAVTNFDLSTYIRWLRPGASSESAPNSLPPQHPKSNQDQSLSTPTSSDHFLTKEGRHQMHILQSYSFKPEDIDTVRNRDIFQRHQQLLPMPISPCAKSSSSPTALGLLLQSSVFKELVENNLNGGGEESWHKEASSSSADTEY